MKPARYYPDPDLKQFSPLNVVKTHEDGTVDLADGKGTLIVTSCPVSDSPKVGHAVLVEDPAPKPKAK